VTAPTRAALLLALSSCADLVTSGHLVLPEARDEARTLRHDLHLRRCVITDARDPDRTRGRCEGPAGSVDVVATWGALWVLQEDPRSLDR
jgi:hypothetical protein